MGGCVRTLRRGPGPSRPGGLPPRHPVTCQAPPRPSRTRLDCCCEVDPGRTLASPLSAWRSGRPRPRVTLAGQGDPSALGGLGTGGRPACGTLGSGGHVGGSGLRPPLGAAPGAGSPQQEAAGGPPGRAEGEGLRGTAGRWQQRTGRRPRREEGHEERPPRKAPITGSPASSGPPSTLPSRRSAAPEPGARAG